MWLSHQPPLPVELRGALETQLFGINEQGTLVGTFLDPLGYQSGFTAVPAADSLRPGTSVARGADAANAGVAHACIHSMEGPFRVLNAADVATEGDFLSEPHTSYTLLLSPAASSQLVYRSLGHERISLFVHPPAALRLRLPNGALLPPALVRPSSLCVRIDFVYQFEITAAGDYPLVVDPNPQSTVYVILERSWSYEP